MVTPVGNPKLVFYSPEHEFPVEMVMATDDHNRVTAESVSGNSLKLQFNPTAQW
jgi:hypothetical protein